MEDNKGISSIPWWAWLVIPGSALLLWKLFRNTARGANKITRDLSSSEAQAAKFYGYFGITILPVTGATATPVVKNSTLNLIGWLARNINDWDRVQDAFTRLCGGNYTIIQAATTALNTSEYTAFMTLIENALRQKRIFCGNAAFHSLYNATRYGGIAGENFDANAFVGRCISEDDMYYSYISWRDGVTYQCEKQHFILV